VVPPDSSEHDPTTWRGSSLRDEVRTGADVRSVLERAHETQIPYQYESEELLKGDHVAEMFRTRGYTRVRVIYNCGVESNSRIKLFTRGHFWGGDDEHQRFQAQYRREPRPTETIPFDTYEVWMRYQYGTIERDSAGNVVFVSDADQDGETLRRLDWPELYPPVKRRLAELELVRNPAFARYRLLEREEWDEFERSFRYDPIVFGVGP